MEMLRHAQSRFHHKTATNLEPELITLVQNLPHPPGQRLLVVLVQVVRVALLLHGAELLADLRPQLQRLGLHVVQTVRDGLAGRTLLLGQGQALAIKEGITINV